MPKERHHLLLAEEVLRALVGSGSMRTFSRREEDCFYLGVLWPDHLFYDLPTFEMKRVGRALHVLEGPDGPHLLGDWLSAHEIPSADREIWALGLACHFHSDSHWHPLINRLSRPPFAPCAHLGLTPGVCHHHIESELEAYWVERRGPADGYRSLLGRLAAALPAADPLMHAFRDLLRSLEAPAVPPLPRLRRCLRWQNALTRLFSQKVLSKQKRLLLRFRSLQPFGALIVPRRSDLFPGPPDRCAHPIDFETLIDPVFFDECVRASASRLRALPGRWP